MYTAYDKAIAAFITSLLGILAMFKLPVGWVTPEVVAALVPFLTMVVTWLVPNLPEKPTPVPEPEVKP